MYLYIVFFVLSVRLLWEDGQCIGRPGERRRGRKKEGREKGEARWEKWEMGWEKGEEGREKLPVFNTDLPNLAYNVCIQWRCDGQAGVRFSLLSPSSLFSHPLLLSPGLPIPCPLSQWNRHRNVYVRLTPQSGQPLKPSKFSGPIAGRFTEVSVYILYWRCPYCLELVFRRIFKIPSWT